MALWFCFAANAAAQSDTQPPQLLSLAISPAAVDVTLAPQTETFTLHVTDNLSGIYTAQVYLRSPSGAQFAGGSVFPPGLVLDATFNVPVVIERYSQPGIWTIATVLLRDRAGNQVGMNTGALAAAGFPTTFTVIDASPDTQAPQLAAISMSPNVVDVSAAAATVTVDATITDDLSGTATGRTVSFGDFEVRSPSGRQSRFISILQRQLVAGTSLNGVWRATFNMPRYSEPGVWKVVGFVTVDQTGNRRFHTAAALAALGASVELTVASTPFDMTPPVLTGLTFTPAFINTSLGPQTIQTDFAMADDLSGVGFWSDTPFFRRLVGARFTSPSGAQFLYSNSFSNAPPILGTPLNGVWRFPASFPQFSEEGTWRVDVMLRDNVRNLLTLGNAQLAAMGISNTIEVIRPSLQPDGTITDPAAGGTITDNTFGNRAKLVIPGGVLSQPTTVAIDVLSSPLGIPLPTGFSSAETYYVNVEFTPPPAFPLPPPGITVILPLRNYTIPGTTIDLFRVDPITAMLTPALNTSGNPVIGIVDAGGLTATFAGVARFSTVVGLLPDAIPVAVDIKPGETPNTINTKSNGVIPAAIFSTPTLDLTTIDPGTVRLSGIPVAQNKDGKWQVANVDVNADGLEDIIAHFEMGQLLLGPSDALAVVEGMTLDGRRFRGTDSVKIVK